MNISRESLRNGFFVPTVVEENKKGSVVSQLRRYVRVWKEIRDGRLVPT